jgi:L-amino acid N-acyltransferase YncA
MKLIRLRANSIRRLKEIERTPSPQTWVAEVESFILDGGAASHRHEPLSAVLLADDDGRVVGAAVHHPSGAFPGAQYISAVLVDHRTRGRGLGRELMAAVIADARDRSSREYVIWLVHPDNVAMVALSRSIVASGTELGHDRRNGYLIFVDP